MNFPLFAHSAKEGMYLEARYRTVLRCFVFLLLPIVGMFLAGVDQSELWRVPIYFTKNSLSQILQHPEQINIKDLPRIKSQYTSKVSCEKYPPTLSSIVLFELYNILNKLLSRNSSRINCDMFARIFQLCLVACEMRLEYRLSNDLIPCQVRAPKGTGTCIQEITRDNDTHGNGSCGMHESRRVMRLVTVSSKLSSDSTF